MNQDVNTSRFGTCAIVAGLDIPTVPAILWPEVAPRPTRRQARAGLFFVEVRRAD